MMLRRWAAGLLAICGATAIACAAAAGPSTDDIVTTIPWSVPESYDYVLLDDDGNEEGRTTLSVERDGARLVLRQVSSDDEGNSDESSLTVDAMTLKPIEATREIVDGDEQRSLITTVYGPLDDGDPGVTIRQQIFNPPDEGDPDDRTSLLKLKRDGEGHYDNDASLFLWRTIPFEDGYEETYNAVIANRREQRPVTLRVLDRETVETPAGEFDSWFVVIEAEGQSHEAWFLADGDHRLLKYDNDNVVFLYVE